MRPAGALWDEARVMFARERVGLILLGIDEERISLDVKEIRSWEVPKSFR